MNDLRYAVNTNWDLFEHQPTKTYYLRHETSWLKATDVAGPWTAAGTLPPSFAKLPADDNWKEVKAAVPGKKLDPKKAPKVFVSTIPAELILVGTAYSYLQEYLPHVAQHAVRTGGVDVVGLGRMTLAYPAILSDAVQAGTINNKIICRTFSDCTTAPRNGMISGCYPLDKYYSAKPEFQKLKEIKKAAGV